MIYKRDSKEMNKLPYELIKNIEHFLTIFECIHLIYTNRYLLRYREQKFCNILYRVCSKYLKEVINETIKIPQKNISLKLFSYDKNIISKISKIHTLDLSYCKITDVSTLRNVHTLNLSFCEITDVLTLRNVHTLNLSGCKNITDVSTLENVHTLDLSGCKNITDVSKLGNVHMCVE
jgi:Leucine-rich repeat (LRR) protein